MSYPIVWFPSPKFTPGHPAPLVALVHHRMVGTLASTDATFTTGARVASTNFGIGWCTKHSVARRICIHQYVALGDQAWGNGNWDPSGQWDDHYPTLFVNSRTVSIEHEDGGNKAAGAGKGVVVEDIIAASLWLDRQLLDGNLAGMRVKDAGTIRAELRAIPLTVNHIIDHHYIAGKLKPSCWRPWADDPVGFPQARYLAELAPAPVPEDTVNSYPVPKVPTIGTVAKGIWLYDSSGLQPSPGNIQVDPGRDLPYLGQPTTTTRVVEYVDAQGVHTGKAMFVKAPEFTNLRAVPDPTPFSQAQLDAAEKLAAAAVKAAADHAAAAYGA